MKTIILATDFSKSSTDAARYGYALACFIKARVVILNAMIITAEVPQTGFVTWPDEEFDGLQKDYEAEIKKFKAELEGQLMPGAFRPPVICVNEAGRVAEVIKNTTAAYQADLVVIGTHQGGLLSSLLIGNHAEQLIDAGTGPLLIVKSGTIFQPIKKIALATEFKNPEQDLDVIYNLITLAKLLDAEILLTHITNKHENAQGLRKSMEAYLLELSNKADYPHIYYRLIPNEKTEEGLAWLCEYGQVDMLAMAHHARNVLAEYFGAGYTKKMNKLSDLPLLVFPAE